MKVLDDDGNECAPGVSGEIYMRPAPGSAPTYRYIGATAKSRDGWDSLGDLGYFDADGFLYLTDRRVDMFTVGGRNVYPAEIESALSAHPDVLSCLVVGVPDDDLGQVPHAMVQADGLDEAAVVAFLSDRDRRLQGAAHGGIRRHPAARRRRKGPPLGGARRGHRATAAHPANRGGPNCPSGERRTGCCRDTPSGATLLGTAIRPARSSPPRSRSRTPSSAPARPACGR